MKTSNELVQGTMYLDDAPDTLGVFYIPDANAELAANVFAATGNKGLRPCTVTYMLSR